MRPPSNATVRGVVIATVLLTLFHFADNTLAIDTYPSAGWQPDWFEWVVAASWPLFTLLGVLGYRHYRDGDFRRAHVFLAFYSYTGFVSLAHFAYGGPDDLTRRALVSVIIDAFAGAAVLGVTLWSVSARRTARRAG